MQFSLRQPFTVIDAVSGGRSSAPDVVVVGRQTRRNLDLSATGDVVTLTVHFQPTGFYRLFHVPLHHLTDLRPDAADVVGTDVRVVQERIAEASGAVSMVGHVERFLLGRIDGSRPLHPVQTAALSLLNLSGTANLQVVAAESQLSLRQFERVFMDQVGVRPKLFSRIARFAHALQSKNEQPDRSWADVAVGAGYYDQMHFVRNCHSFGGESPTGLFKTWMDCRP